MFSSVFIANRGEVATQVVEGGEIMMIEPSATR